MSSILEKIDTDVDLPYDEELLKRGNPFEVAEYMLTLVKRLKELLEQVVLISNYSVDLADAEAVYFSLPQSDGTYANGTWRMIQVGDNLETQCKISGTWTTVFTRERPV